MNDTCSSAISRMRPRAFITEIVQRRWNSAKSFGPPRIRVRFAGLRGTLVRKPIDSRLRGNDINGTFAVIPAKAGIHTAYPNTNGPPRLPSEP